MALDIQNRLSINNVDKDGDVELELETMGHTGSIYLSQEEIKQVIDFLKQQLK